MRAASYLARHSKPPLTDIEEQRLGRKALAGDLAARDKLVEHNINFALFVAGSWCRDVNYARLANDITQEACVALTEAASTYNGAVRFASYSRRLITWRIMKMIDGLAGETKMTFGTTGVYKAVKRKIHELGQFSQRRPDVEEVVEALDGDVYAYLVRAVMASMRPVELDKNRSRDGDDFINLHELLDLRSDRHEEIMSDLIRGERKEILDQCLRALLKEETYDIAAGYFGLSGGVPVSLHDQSIEKGCTHQNLSAKLIYAFGKIEEDARDDAGPRGDICRKLLALWEDCDD